MTDTMTCPDCGTPNPAGATHCASCNFPFAAHEGEGRRGDAEPEPKPASLAGSTPGMTLPRRPRRPRRSRPQQQAVSLWLLFAAFAAMAVVWIAVQANLDRGRQSVEGAREDQQQRADQFGAALARDSNDVEAHIGLADVLFDTGNWSEAIVHYRAAIRRDSSRVSPIVDVGVCYYNLGDAEQAERCFKLALVRDPRQPIALFNMGIVNERRGNYEEALSYLHRALESGVPPGMDSTLVDAIRRVQQRTGRAAPPLQQGTP
jgi:Tfp pilus assembly protein PilF